MDFEVLEIRDIIFLYSNTIIIMSPLLEIVLYIMSNLIDYSYC